MKISFYTLGCKVNQYETAVAIEKFKEKGYEIANFNDVCDVYVINSCSVTNLATRKTRNMVSKTKKMNKEAIVVLMGCYANEGPENNKADIVIGNEEKKDIFTIVEMYSIKVSIVTDISKVKKYSERYVLKKKTNLREYIKIEDGCNNFCTYCIIPYVRGRVRSRNIEEIVKEAENLIKSGAKEIVLTGIEIASYGTDTKTLSLIDVIKKVSSIDKNVNIRLGSLDPRWMQNVDNIKKLAEIKNICNHFHLSLQSLDNNILSRMNRKYTVENIYEIKENLDKYFNNNYSITTDIITGFIDETDEEFLNTYRNLDNLDIFNIHVFKYSKRKYTKASKLSTTVTDEMKKIRSEKLIKLAEKLKNRYLSKYINTKVTVLLEEYKEGYLYGYTNNYIYVKVKGDEKLWGSKQEIELQKIEKNFVLGKI